MSEPLPVVRMHTTHCTEPRARHEACRGTAESDGVRFVCVCLCHQQPALFPATESAEVSS